MAIDLNRSSWFRRCLREYVSACVQAPRSLALAFLVSFGPGAMWAQEAPPQIVDRARSAVDGAATTPLKREWDARLATDPSDRSALLGLATLARLEYEYDRSDSLYFRLLPVGSASPDGFAVWARLGHAEGLQARGLFVQAQETYMAAAREAGAVDSLARAWALLRLAGVRTRFAGNAMALEVLREAGPLIPPGGERLRAYRHCLQATLGGLQDDAWAGLEEARIGAELAERAGDLRLQAFCLHAAGGLHARNGYASDALDLLSRADDLQRRVGDRAGRAATLQWMGYLLITQSSYGAARRVLHEAIAEGEASRNLSPVAWAYLNLASIAVYSGDRPEAWSHIGSAVRIFRMRGGDPYGEEIAELIRARALTASGRLEDAREAYLDLLPRLESRGKADEIFGVLESLADLAMVQEDWDSAREWLDRAHALALSRDMSSWASGLQVSLAEVSLTRGELEQAERYLESALASADQPLRRYRGLARRAELHARRGELARAEADLTRAADFLDEWRAGLDRDGLRRFVFQLSEKTYDRDLCVATVLAALAENGRGEAAFRLVERQRARDLLDQLIRADALTAGAEDVAHSSLPAAGPVAVGAREVADALPDDRTALLEYLTGTGGEPTTLFVVTRSGLRTHRLRAIDSLSADLERFRAMAASGMQGDRLARTLAQELLAPALATLPPETNRLAVVTDGPLHLLPFDLLLLESGELLVERYAVSRVPSAAVATELWARGRRANGSRILVLADPDLETMGTVAHGGAAAALRAAFEEEGGLPRLPGSRGEARAIGRFGDEAEIRFGRDASETFLKRARLDEYRVLHFATHARVDDQRVARTALALAPGGGEDGFLQPAELATLSLEADLVVLSACRTAAGVVIRGEGVYGLTAPFLEAGARSVLASSWRVSDRATASFVRAFYDGLARGEVVGEALRQAKLRALRAGTPSSEWAAFTLVGDPSVRVPLRERSRGPGGAILLAVLLGLAAVSWLARRKVVGRGDP